jgi:hypothetical protein
MRRPSSLLAVLPLALHAACGGGDGGTETPVPTTVTVTPASVTLSALGATQTLTAQVRDQNNNVMNGQGVTWTSTNTAAATVSPAGVVTAVANGTATVRAAAGSVQGSASVTVAQTVSALVKVSGDGQTALVGTALPTPLVARANDSRGNPVAGVTVNLAVTQGGGSLSAASQVTAANGQTAGVTWTIGNVAGAAQQVTASASGAGAATFGATATAGAPASVAAQAGNDQTGPAGLALPTDPAVIVRDALSNPVPNAIVTFAVTGGGGSVTGAVDTTGSNGIAAVGNWVLGAPGTNTLTATVTGAGISGNPVTFNATATVAGAPASVAVLEGNGQTGLVGFALNVPPAVIVRDTSNAPVPNVQVDFAVTGGGGSVTDATVMTGTDGVARVGSWVMGAAPGANGMTATVAAAGVSGNPVALTATGAPKQYNIEVRFQTPVTPAQQVAFDSAEARWERLIYGDLPDVSLSEPATTCATVSIPEMNETVDDIVIFARMDSIDGPGAPGVPTIVGVASPCNPVRAGSLLIIRGVMRFDTADVAGILAQGLFDEVVMHEMGHVLGFTPALWSPKGLIVDPSLSGGTDPRFIGAQAIAAFDRSGGASYSAGAKVPLENTGGAGTADAHWRQTVFATELMTGTLDNGVPNPLSVITTAAMGDLGYTVNYAGSDAYVVANPLGLTVGAVGAVTHLRELLPALDEIVEVDRTGRVVRVRRVR